MFYTYSYKLHYKAKPRIEGQRSTVHVLIQFKCGGHVWGIAWIKTPRVQRHLTPNDIWRKIAEAERTEYGRAFDSITTGD